MPLPFKCCPARVDALPSTTIALACAVSAGNPCSGLFGSHPPGGRRNDYILYTTALRGSLRCLGIKPHEPELPPPPNLNATEAEPQSPTA